MRHEVLDRPLAEHFEQPHVLPRTGDCEVLGLTVSVILDDEGRVQRFVQPARIPASRVVEVGIGEATDEALRNARLRLRARVRAWAMKHARQLFDRADGLHARPMPS